jgi:histidyl-tRNA synthetase
MEFQAVKGTRDFYPEDMRLRTWIMDAWRRVSLRNGFEEYDAPIFEYLDLFTAKSGPEIAEQLFSFTDRGERNLAIRPEITPSLARMVNAKVNSLPRPIKWFSMPRVCRAEKPQKGRLREFFQWNIDVIGCDDVIADAECIFVCVDLLRELGLTPADVVVRIGSRSLTTAALAGFGVPQEKLDDVLPVLDKRPKVSPEEYVKLAKLAGLNDDQIAKIGRLQDSATLEEVRQNLPAVEGIEPKLAELQRLLELLATMGAAEYCRLDLRIVRGLAYYTGIVYEAFDAAESLRAVAGGGRYDNLLEVLGGPKIGATGFGMGDVVLGILLEEKGKIPAGLRAAALDFFVIEGGESDFPAAMRVLAALRQKGFAADFSYKRQNVGKQLKDANRRGAKRAVIVRSTGVSVKDLATGEQKELSLDEFLVNP